MHYISERGVKTTVGLYLVESARNKMPIVSRNTNPNTVGVTLVRWTNQIKVKMYLKISGAEVEEMKFSNLLKI